MAIIKSKTKPTDELFLSNKAVMETLVTQLNQHIETIKQGGGEKAIEHQRQKGKLPHENASRACLMTTLTFLKSASLPPGKCMTKRSPALVLSPALVS